MCLTNGVDNTFCRVIVYFGKVSGGSAMRTHDRYDAWDSYERAQDAIGENVLVGNDDIDFDGGRFQETPPYIAATMRSVIKAHEEQHQLNAAMFHSFTDFQRKIDFGQGTVKPEGSKSSTRRRRTSSRSSDLEESIGDSSSSSHNGKRNRHHRDHSWMNLRRLNLLHLTVR